MRCESGAKWREKVSNIGAIALIGWELFQIRAELAQKVSDLGDIAPMLRKRYEKPPAIGRSAPMARPCCESGVVVVRNGAKMLRT